MFVFLRWVIRLISLVVFVFSLWEFGVHLYGWIIYQPTAPQQLALAQLRGPALAQWSEAQANRAKQEAERSQQTLEEMQQTGEPQSDSSIFRSMDYNLGSISYKVDSIDYQLGLTDYSVTTIREKIELLLSLVAFVVSSILVLVAWKPDLSYVNGT